MIPDEMSSEDLTSLSHLEKDFIPKLNKNFTRVGEGMAALDTRVINVEYDIHNLTDSMETWENVLNRFSLFDEEGSFDKIMQFEERLEKLEEKIEGLEKKYQEHLEKIHAEIDKDLDYVGNEDTWRDSRIAALEDRVKEIENCLDTPSDYEDKMDYFDERIETLEKAVLNGSEEDLA